MPRRGNVAKREVLADPIYNSKVVTRLVNYIMLDGKKGVAQEIVYDAFNIVKEKTGKTRSICSRRLWRTSCLTSSARPAVSAALTTRSPWRSALPAARRSACAG